MVGVIGSILTLFSLPVFDKMRIDDPVGKCCGENFCELKILRGIFLGAIAVHGVAGIWGNFKGLNTLENNFF